MGDFGLGALMRLLAVTLVVFPLGLWKLAEVIWWLATNVKVTW